MTAEEVAEVSKNAYTPKADITQKVQYYQVWII